MLLGIYLSPSSITQYRLSLENRPFWGLSSIIRNCRSCCTSGASSGCRNHSLHRQIWWQVTIMSPNAAEPSLVHRKPKGLVLFSCAAFDLGSSDLTIVFYSRTRPLKPQTALWLQIFWFCFLSFPVLILRFVPTSIFSGILIKEGLEPWRGAIHWEGS